MNHDSNAGKKDEHSTGGEWKEMRGERMNNDHDPSFGTPQEANTAKHINFPESEEPSIGITGDDDNNPAKQQWEEMREERMNNDQDPSLSAPQQANTQKHIAVNEGEK